MAKRSRELEWIGGLVSMPGYVTNEGEPYRPELLVWMSAAGAVMGTAMGKPGQMISSASEQLRDACARPMIGPPHTPTRVRVASPELASILRAGHPTLDVVVAATPELDAMLASMRAHFSASADPEDDGERSFRAGGHTAEAVGRLFRAAAVLFRAKPWKVVPDDHSLFSISVEAEGVRGAVVSVIGQQEESFGVLVFESIADFDRYVDAAEAAQQGEEPNMPPHFSLNFDRGADVPASLRKEIVQHRWEVAAADGYPWLAAMDPDLVPRPATAKELALTEHICLALPVVLRDKKELEDAWTGGAPYEKTVVVEAAAGPVSVVVRAPHEDDAISASDVDELMEAAQAADHALMGRFSDSPEGKGFDERHAVCMLADLSNAQFGPGSVTMLRAPQLRELLFELVPAKIFVEPDEAPGLIAELRAFYTFMKRDQRLPHADECLRVLGRAGASKLRAALADPSKFGMAKSMLVAGRDAGFDISTKEGVEAWMRELQGKPLPPSISLPGMPARLAASHAAQRAKKDKRKATRKARKKTR